MSDKPNILWDLPTRIGHWLIVVCIPLSWWSAENENYDLHQWLGYTVIVVVVSRIAWGILGSPHSRFADFLVGPGKVIAYLRGEQVGSVGHNPMGGWSVVLLLLLLLLQAVSGLFNSDDVFFNGPLYYAASVGLRDAMGEIHEVTFWLLVGLICLHIGAVLYHQLRLKEPLLQAMLRGRANGRNGLRAPAPGWRALLIVLAVSALLWGVLRLAPAPPPLMW